MRKIENDVFGIPERSKTINQKKKGNANELVLAKAMTEWCGFEIRRVPSSGGLRHANNHTLVGDISTGDLDKDFPIVVETKHLANLQIPTKDFRANSKVFTIWEQVKRDSERCGKVPFLALRKNGMQSKEWAIFLYEKHFTTLGLEAVCKGSKVGEETICMIYFSKLVKISWEKFCTLIKNP